MSEDKSGWDSIFSPERIQHFGMKALLTLSEQLLEMFHRRWPHLFFLLPECRQYREWNIKVIRGYRGNIFVNQQPERNSLVEGWWMFLDTFQLHRGILWRHQLELFFAQQKYRWIKYLVKPCFVQWKMVQILPPPPMLEWRLKNIYRRYLLSQPCCWRLVSVIVTKYGYGPELATNTSKEHSLNLGGCNVVVWTKSCPHLVSTGIGQFILGS